MAEPTPGPWHVPADYSDFQVHGPDGIRVADVLTLQRHAAECEANARLIAAAPDLLAAIKAILPAATHRLSELRTEGALLDADRALAKAEGREP